MGFNSGFKVLNVGNSRPAEQLLASKEISCPCTPPPFRIHSGAVPSGPGSPHYRGLTIAPWRTTVGRTPLDDWSTRRTDPYLTAHDTRKRQPSMPPAGFEPAIPASERPQTQSLDRAATGIGITGNSEILYPASFASVFSQYLRILRSVVFIKPRDTSKAAAAHTFKCKLQKQELCGQPTPCACWRSFVPNYRWRALIVLQQHLLL